MCSIRRFIQPGEWNPSAVATENKGGKGKEDEKVNDNAVNLFGSASYEVRIWQEEHCIVSPVHSGPRKVLSSINWYVSFSVNVENETQENNVARIEFYNLADTMCFGSNFMLVYYTG
jgi:hypothetical protein